MFCREACRAGLHRHVIYILSFDWALFSPVATTVALVSPQIVFLLQVQAVQEHCPVENIELGRCWQRLSPFPSFNVNCYDQADPGHRDLDPT